jgi:hypothetical protein
MSRIRSLAARIAALEGRVDGAVMAEAARELLAGREPRCSPAVRAEAERLAADLRAIDALEGRRPDDPHNENHEPQEPQEPRTPHYE